MDYRSQTYMDVSRSGLRWGGNIFNSRAALARWLASRGVSYSSWARKHQAAARGLYRREAAAPKVPSSIHFGGFSTPSSQPVQPKPSFSIPLLKALSSPWTRMSGRYY